MKKWKLLSIPELGKFFKEKFLKPKEPEGVWSTTPLMTPEDRRKYEKALKRTMIPGEWKIKQTQHVNEVVVNAGAWVKVVVRWHWAWHEGRWVKKIDNLDPFTKATSLYSKLDLQLPPIYYHESLDGGGVN
jgi:hypothetical protein